MNAPSNILEQAETDARAIAERAWLDGYKSGLRKGSASLLMWAKVDESTVTKSHVISCLRASARKLERDIAALEGRKQ